MITQEVLDGFPHQLVIPFDEQNDSRGFLDIIDWMLAREEGWGKYQVDWVFRYVIDIESDAGPCGYLMFKDKDAAMLCKLSLVGVDLHDS